MTKIDIISGFLGAGKTTFIKKMLQEAFSGEQVVLIENEFGEIGIDGCFLKDAGIEIREMNSGRGLWKIIKRGCGHVPSPADSDRAFRRREAFGRNQGGAGRVWADRREAEQLYDHGRCDKMQDLQ